MSLRQFEPFWDLPSNFSMIMYGVRRAGKNVMLMQLLYDMRDRFKDYKVYVFSGSGEVNIEQYSRFPPRFVFSDIEKVDHELKKIKDEQIKAIREVKQGARKKSEGAQESRDGLSQVSAPVVNKLTGQAPPGGRFDKTNTRGRQKELRVAGDVSKEERDEEEAGGDDGPLTAGEDLPEHMFPHILIILDDIVSDSNIRKSPNLNFISTTGRHIYVSQIILSQMVAGSASIPPVVRGQADTIAIAALPRSVAERELIAFQYMTAGTTTKKQALQLLSEATEVKYRGLFIDTTDPSAREPRDFLFTYGPVPFPPRFGKWRMGTSEQWISRKDDSDEKMMRSNTGGVKRKFDPSTIPKTKRGRKGGAAAASQHTLGFSGGSSVLPSFFIA